MQVQSTFKIQCLATTKQTKVWSWKTSYVDLDLTNKQKPVKKQIIIFYT